MFMFTFSLTICFQECTFKPLPSANQMCNRLTYVRKAEMPQAINYRISVTCIWAEIFPLTAH